MGQGKGCEQKTKRNYNSAYSNTLHFDVAYIMGQGRGDEQKKSSIVLWCATHVPLSMGQGKGCEQKTKRNYNSAYSNTLHFDVAYIMGQGRGDEQKKSSIVLWCATHVPLSMGQGKGCEQKTKRNYNSAYSNKLHFDVAYVNGQGRGDDHKKSSIV